MSILIGAGALIGAAGPAHATLSGFLLSKGAGSQFSADYYVNLGVVPGGNAKTWTYKIVNTGPTAQSFKFDVQALDVAMEYAVYDGSELVELPYITEAIPAGGSHALKVKIEIGAGAEPEDYWVAASLYDPADDTLLDEKYAVAQATNQTGTHENNLFLKTGSQPYVGGDVDQVQSSQALKVGQTAKFNFQVVNNNPHPAPVLFYGGLDGCGYSDFATTVKKGSTLIPEDDVINGYDLGMIKPGGKVRFTLRVKLIAPTDCDSTHYYLAAEGTYSPTSFQAAHVLVAYTP
ncbi:hypothetical protein F0U44_07070 [Nocardioides humilatus]|uniref:DUF11 domain-containing protein n=1 Tax=Nocardioides humilatus TaxID=2607660 RepID=A0A5B1LHH5_9ACTN|nr:hypothetical protein [Nocardioides humilatus]KAA1420181.1 hypothetical protein F0U44_07070 [Nocardioides humilatus]